MFFFPCECYLSYIFHSMQLAQLGNCSFCVVQCFFAAAHNCLMSAAEYPKSKYAIGSFLSSCCHSLRRAILSSSAQTNMSGNFVTISCSASSPVSLKIYLSVAFAISLTICCKSSVDVLQPLTEWDSMLTQCSYRAFQQRKAAGYTIFR